mmetsp:Transcript_10228/g.24550  ORF Transcript_10228/g.24550 Transcript_10228/m.24550 type:complete len:563 (-) Transcript_10228:61-1749(-)
MSIDPLSVFLIAFLLAFADQERRYFATWNLPSVMLPVPSRSQEVIHESAQQFKALRRSLIQMVMDACSVLGILLLSVYTIRMVIFGQDSLSSGEMNHAGLLVAWLLTCAAFHTGALSFGDSEMTFLAYAFNFLTLGITFAFQLDDVAKAMLEPMIMMGRIVGCLIFLDWRHACCINGLFAARHLHQQLGEEEQLSMSNCVITEFCVFALIQIVPFSVEILLRKWIAIIVAASDLETALRAAKSVIASSCDAEAELSSELELCKVSPKLGHIFGRQPAELEGKSFLDILDKENGERFAQCLQTSKSLSDESLQPITGNLTITIDQSGIKKDVRIHVCSLSTVRDGRSKYIMALSEVHEGLGKPEPDIGSDVPEIPEHGHQEVNDPAPDPDFQPFGFNLDELRLTESSLEDHSWAARGKRSLSSLAEVKVHLDEQTLEIQDIQIVLNTGHWKKSRKTFLKECILPGSWEGFKRWLDAAAKGRPGTDVPWMVPFGFPRVMGGIACARNIEVRRKVGTTGRSELSLRLRHIFIRRPISTDQSTATHNCWEGRVRKGTPSVASRGTL